MKRTIKDIFSSIINKNKTLSVMESCTGGKVCDEITNIEGSSAIFKFGAVAYSNEYKIKMGVSPEKIEKYGVYSSEVACEMAKRISEFAESDYGIGITGKLNCEDIKNPKGKNNMVYISLYNRSSNKFYNSCVETNYKDRNKNKNEVLCGVADIMYSNI